MILSENKTFEFRKGKWFLLIKETPETYEAYIQNDKYSLIILMYGLQKKDIDLWEFIEMAYEDMEEYAEIYKEECYYDEFAMDC